jgi:aromatic-L-amino-acid decarboxylase
MGENKQEPVQKEETLDPENWDEMKKLGRQMVEDMLTYQQNLRNKPQFKYITDEVLNYFKTKVPLEPIGAERTYEDFKKMILENITPRYGSPRCWYTVLGPGTPFGALSDMWMSGLNNITAENNRFSIGPEVELQVLSWLKEVLGYPLDSSGILVSGCSHANLTGLIVARNVKAGGNIKENGILSKLTFYGSQEMHTSIQRAIEVMGIGSKNLRKIRVDDNFKINIDELKEKVKEDRKAGYTPCGVIGCAGATNVASFDDLDAIADLCQEQDLWFHVDGAFGA